MATTVTQSELDAINEENAGAVSTQTSNTEQTYTGKFVGTLIGNATTAKELEAPYNFTLTGDATGTTKVNAKDVALKVTVNHATEADTADFAGKTNLAARATLADMANTAEFAYRAGRFAKVVINLTGAVIGSGEATNSETVDVKITDIDASNLFVVGSLATNPDTKKVYVDVTGRHFWIFDTVNSKWVDCFKTLADELDAHGLRLDALETLNAGDRLTALETRTDTNEDTLSNHETRIKANETQIANHEARINDIEVNTDLGQFTTRIQAIESKNTEQDNALNDEAVIRLNKDNELEQKNTELDTKIDSVKTELDTKIDGNATSIFSIQNKDLAQDATIDLNYEVNSFVEKLSLKQLYSDYMHANSTVNDRSIQGAAVHGHVIYYTICKTDNSYQELHQIDLDKKTHRLLKTYTDLGHTNSLMYYNNKLYTVTGASDGNIKVIDLTSLEVEQGLNVKDLTNTNDRYMVGIAYDDVNDKFVGRGADGFYIIDPATFKTVDYYAVNPNTDSTGITNSSSVVNVATQGITCHNGLYYCNNCFNIYLNTNNTLGVNVVSVYNKAKLVHTFFIANTYGEIEDIDFIDDQLVVTAQRINGNSLNGFSYYIYKANIYKNANNFSEWDAVQRDAFSSAIVSAPLFDYAIYVDADASRFKPQLGTKDYPFYSLDDAIAYACHSKSIGRMSFHLKGDFYSKNKPVVYIFGYTAKPVRITNWTDSETDPDGYILPSVEIVSTIYAWIQYGTIKEAGTGTKRGLYLNHVKNCFIIGMKILNPDKTADATGIAIGSSTVTFTGQSTTIDGFDIGINPSNTFIYYQTACTFTNCITQIASSSSFPLLYTGLVIDRIIISNATCIRYQSGLQICFNKIMIPTGQLAAEWTYPLAFKTIPTIVCSPNSQGRKVSAFYSPTTTKVNVSIKYIDNTSVLGENTQMHVMAIGFWK